MATLNPISQRIALEGTKEIAEQLKAMGVAGDAALKQIVAAAQQATTQLSPFQQRLQAVGAAFTDFGNKVAAAAGTIGTVKLGNLSQEFGNLETSATKVIKRVSILSAGILAAATAAGLFVKSAAQAADDAEDNADSLGLSIKAYQGLSFAAASAGIAQDKFTAGLKILSKGVTETAEGQSKALDDFERGFGVVNAGLLQRFGLIGIGADAARDRLSDLGVRVVGLGEQFDQLRARMVATGVRFTDLGKNITDSDKGLSDAGKAIKRFGVDTIDLSTRQIRPLEDILGDLAEKFKALGRGPEAAARAQQIFGRAGNALLPLLLKGKAGVDELTASFNALGIGITATDAQIGEENVAAFTRLSFILDGLKTKLGLVFAPALTSVINAITDAINRNQLALREFATQLGERIKPVVADVVAVLSGKDATAGGFVDSLVQTFNKVVPAVTSVIEQIRAAFNGLISFLDAIAQKINAVFGTNLTVQGLAIILVVGQITGAFGLLTTAVGLLAAGVVTLTSVFALLTSPIGLIVLGVAAATAAFIIFKDDIVAGFQALPGLITSAVSGLADIIAQPFRTAFANITGVIDDILGLIRRVVNAIASIRLPSFSSNGELPEPGGVPFARGGMVWGPGTQTSDSIFARLSRGEFVMRAAAVDRFGPSFFAALNSLRMPKFSLGGLVDDLSRAIALPPMPRFADGGLIPAAAGAGGGRSFTLNIGGHSFGGLTGPANVLDQLEQHAVLAQISSGGKKPRWRR